MAPRSPILLFGMPRSGTTWLGKLFDSHPRTLYRHEPDTYAPLNDIPLLADATSEPVHGARLRAYLDEVVAMRSERVCAKQPTFPKAYTSITGTALHKLSGLASKFAGRFGVELPVVGAGASVDGDEWRLAWKSIESLGRLGLMMRAYPDAVSVQILRHPCGYVNSVLRGEAAGRFAHNAAAEDFGIFELLCASDQALRRALTVDHFKDMSAVERLAWRWVLFNEKAAEDTAGSGRSMVLPYEQLCADPASITKQMFEFCKLEWDEQTGDFIAASTTETREEYYSVFKNPLESAWKWQRNLAAGDVATIMSVAAQSTLGATYTSGASWSRAVL